jgi:hypothetical protein
MARTQRGSISIVVCASVVMFATGAIAIADAGSFLVARERAEAAADAAALAAVSRQSPVLGQSGDPVDAARDAAARNGATLVRCDCRVGSPTAVVEVEITPRAVMLSGWRGRRVRAQAQADLAEWLSSYRA